MASTAWENSALNHALLFEKVGGHDIDIKFNIPPINLDHIKNMTTDFGIIQFSKINQPDRSSGYTLDDNARAMVAFCQHYAITNDKNDLDYILLYLNFIKYCINSDGTFRNYVDEEKEFTSQNYSTNLEDSNGRAIWALGYLLSIRDALPKEYASIASVAEGILKIALKNVTKIHSPRAMAFVIKGLYYANKQMKSDSQLALIKELADRLVQMYRHEAHYGWQWFESYLTYANGILPEALLCAWLATKNIVYKEIAKSSFNFLLSKTFVDNNIKVISNKNWLHKGENTAHLSIGGEQPIDVAYTIIALDKFHNVFPEEDYHHKMEKSFGWFLGSNHLSQIIYNPCTGGCYDGLEMNSVNLNQGSESAVSYLMARMTIEKSKILAQQTIKQNKTIQNKKRIIEFA